MVFLRTLFILVMVSKNVKLMIHLHKFGWGCSWMHVFGQHFNSAARCCDNLPWSQWTTSVTRGTTKVQFFNTWQLQSLGRWLLMAATNSVYPVKSRLSELWRTSLYSTPGIFELDIICLIQLQSIMSFFNVGLDSSTKCFASSECFLTQLSTW